MPMIKNFATIDLTVTGALASVELGQTPFQIGGNAILHLTAAIGGAGVVTIQGSPDNTTWTTMRTVNAAQSAPLQIELTDLPKYIRMNVTTAGTGTTVPTLEGVQ